MMTNAELMKILDAKRRKNGRVYNGDIRQIGQDLLKNKVDVSPLVIGQNYEIDFVYFHVVLSRDHRDFEKQLKDIEPFLDTLDSWYRVDNLITYFKKPIDFDFYYQQAQRYLKSENIFVKRLGYVGFLKSDLTDIDNCQRIIDLFSDTNKHTLIMAQAWVMSVMYIYQPRLVFNFFRTSNFSYPLISAALSKCTDSYRISNEEKVKIRKLRPILKMQKER